MRTMDLLTFLLGPASYITKKYSDFPKIQNFSDFQLYDPIKNLTVAIKTPIQAIEITIPSKTYINFFILFPNCVQNV